jgi:hypothetical protein
MVWRIPQFLLTAMLEKMEIARVSCHRVFLTPYIEFSTVVLPNIDTWRGQWALRNGCESLSSSVTRPLEKTSMSLWNCSSTNPAAIIIGYSVAGLGHSWPGTLGLDGGVTSFNATTASIIPFFNNHTLRGHIPTTHSFAIICRCNTQ